MGRGKSQVTIVKNQINEAMKTAEIIKLATNKVEQKLHEKKSLIDSAREHIGKMIDRIDPLEAGAVFATAILIKVSINWAEELPTTKAGQDLLKTVARFGSMGLSDWYTLFIPSPTTEQAQAFRDILNSPHAEVIEWLFSFACAYIIVQQAKSLQATSITNVAGLARGLLGLI